MAIEDHVAILALNHVDQATAFSEGPFHDLWLDFGSDSYAVSGGTNPLPPVNLKDPDLDLPWHSMDTSKEWTWFQVDLGASRMFDGVVLVDTNLTSSSRWRILSSDDEGFSTGVVDSGWMVARPPVIPFGKLPWGSFPWGGQISVEVDGISPYNIDLYVRTPPQIRRYVRLYVDDELNPDGFISAGRLIVGPIYQPTNNMALGWDIAWVDNSQTTRTYGNSVSSEEKIRYRQLNFTLEYLTEDEVYLNIFEYIDRQKGTVKELYVIPQPTKPDKFMYEAMYCKLADIRPITNPIHEGRTREMIFEELG